jgi:tetratricopeptide (TPR) repeat protein
MSEVLQSVSAWLTSQRSGKWLMVIDNADSEKLFGSSRDLNLFPGEQSTKSHIAPYLPRSSTGSILVTTRNKKVGIRVSGGCVVLVPTLGLSDGKAMLKRRLIKDVIWKDTKAEELLQLLEFLPLAISQAASYINEEDVDMNHYVNLLLNHKTRRSVLEANYYDPRRDHGTPNAVFLSWQVSFDEISVKAPRSAELLSHAVFLDRHSIPPLFLQQEDEDPVSFDRAVGTLKAYSFVKLGKHRGTLSIHPLIQACTHAWLAKQQSTLHWQESAMDMVFRRCPPSPNFDHWPAWHVIAPHIGQVLCYDTGTKSFSLQRASILASVAVYDRRQGRLELSIARARKALAIFQAYLGDEHPNTLDAMYALAMALKSDRSFPAAEILMRQVLEKRALLLGDHAHTTAAIQGLVRILAAQKKFTEAERLSRESLSRSESSLGLNHPDTLTAMNDLGMMLSKMKKYEESEDLFRRCFQRKLNTLGKNNRETLGAMGNLGSALSGQGKSKNAKKILEELVQQSEVALGEEDGDTILARNNLGIVLCQVGDYEDALFVFHRNEAMCRKVFGPQHLRTLECMKNTSACNSTQSRRS